MAEKILVDRAAIETLLKRTEEDHAALDALLKAPPVLPDLIGEWRAVTQPTQLATGRLAEALTLTGVLRMADLAAAKYQKYIGANGSGCAKGALCVGSTPTKGELQVWVEDGAEPVVRGLAVTGLVVGKRFGFAVRLAEDKLEAAITGTKTCELPAGWKRADGETWLGQGVYQNTVRDPLMPPAEVVILRAYRTLHSDAQIQAELDEYEAAGWVDK